MTRVLCLFANVFMMAALVQSAIAQDFRIETEVLMDGQTDPVSANLTLFEGGLIYDFLLNDDAERTADEIAIFDTRQRQFVLLDVHRKKKAIIPEFRVTRMLSAIRSQGVVKDEFLINPEFVEKFDIASGWLTLESERLTYRAKGERPENGTVLPIYHEFIDQFARLNATDPRRMPPFARLKLNAAIKKYGFIPSEIHMELKVPDDHQARTVKLQSKHFVIWQLSKDDKEQIAAAKKFWMIFDEVSLREYRELAVGGRVTQSRDQQD